ncbi:Ig-like domain-containing domain [Arundinibacter roseus]|uniref:SbsA Ig-like domain-containing protein n=1 Tax=Arundinibacter roseus TaxID=2070510 RepID=A0A4R4JTL0_9BACT|nr:Ig-like domain-containing domain [Arundinibacter roseus]TDB57346.1 hypothetical protein EZE20_23685 [Arundinibacter roseus]
MKKFWLYLITLWILGSCAQQVAPTGGKKDTIAPELVGSNPENKTLNFGGKDIELFFDEYVIVDNIQQKLIITPETENPYNYKQKGKSVVLSFKKSFADSTTYTFNFGDGIKDFSERNPAQNLKLVFSTGPSIDSSRIYGQVTDQRTGQPIFDALVGLYKPKDTLNPEKQKPYYFSRTDSSGTFSIENIQASAYRLIATDDKNRNQLYNPKDERIAFLDSTINVGNDSTSYQLKLYLSDITEPRVLRTLPKVNNYTVVFNKGIDSVRVKFMGSDSLPYLLESATQLKFFNSGQHSDTTLVQLMAWDTLGQQLEHEQKIAFLVQRGKERQLDAFTVIPSVERNQPLARDFTYTFTFNKPIATILDEKVMLVNDTTSRQPLGNLKQTWNSFRNQLTIEGKATARDSIKWDLPYGSVISIEGDTLKAALIKHPVLNEDDYGILRGKVTADSATHFIVELLDKDFKVVRSTRSTPYTFRRIPPGEYKLRLIVDLNNNGRWDTGIFSQGKQPEPILFYNSHLVIKSNFEFDDNNFTIPSKSAD